MNKRRGALCLLLLLALVLALLPAPTRALDIAFVAVNDTIPITLEGGEIPFHRGGSLYLPYSVFDLPSLGVYATYRSEERNVFLFATREQLTFDLDTNTVTDKRGLSQSATCMVSGGEVFVPADFCAGRFGLSISELSSLHGYTIIRLTDGRQVYDDSLFIEKAENLISYRVSQYLSPDETVPVQPVPVQPTPVQPAPVQPVPTAPKPVQPAPEPEDEPKDEPAEEEEEEEEEEEAPDPATVYLCVLGLSNAEEAMEALEVSGVTAAFFVSAAEIEGNGALLRELTSAGHAIGLRAGPEEDIHAALRRANEALDRTLHRKTLLALLPEGTEEAVEAYCAFYAPETPLTAQEAVDAHGEARLLMLQDGGEAREALATLNAGAAVVASLRETTVLAGTDGDYTGRS